MGGREEVGIFNGIIHKAIKNLPQLKVWNKKERENEIRDQNHFSDNHRKS